MKTIITAILTLFSLLCYSQHSSLSIFAPSSGFCTSTLTYRVTVTNIDVVNDPQTLTNTEVTMRVFGIGADPKVDQPIYVDMISGPNIDPGANHLFEVIIQPGTLDENGIYKVNFSFSAAIDENEDPNSPDFNLSLSFCGIGIEDAKNLLMEYVENNINLGEAQTTYLYEEKIPSGTEIASFFTPEFSQILAGNSFLGFVVSDVFSDFQQPSKYIIIDAFTSFISEYDVNWWPVINGNGWNPAPDGDILISELDLSIEGPPEAEFEELEAIPNPKTCALLISGTDDNEGRTNIYQKDIELYKKNLMGNPLGPRLPEEQILVRHSIGKDSILSELQKLREGYDKIYFYYRGHGSQIGKICSGDNYMEWLSYEDLKNELLETEASDFCLIFDCCYSGKSIDVFENDDRICDKNLEIITSATSAKPSKTIMWLNPMDSSIIKGYGVLSHFLNICSSSNEADDSGNGEVSLLEAFDWIKFLNPSIGASQNSIFVDQCPQSFESSPEACGMTINEAKEIINQYVEDNVTLAENQVAYVYEALLESGTSIASFLAEEYNEITEKDLYFSWVISDVYSLFSQPCKFLFLDPITTLIEEVDVNWWAVINGKEYRPFDGSDLITPFNFIEEIPEPIVFEGETFENDTKTCALLISGYDSLYQETLDNALESYKQNLMRNPLGPKLEGDQIVLLKNKCKDEIKIEIEKLKTGYDTIYFYFLGHGYNGSDGTLKASIATGQYADTWYQFKDIATDLLCTEAESIKCLIDCCWAGNLIKEFNANTASCTKDIEVLTSSPKEKTGRYLPIRDANGNLDAIWPYSHYVNSCSGDVSSDSNGDNKVDYGEIDKWIKELDPFFLEIEPSLVDATCPEYFENISARSLSQLELPNLLENEIGSETYLKSDVYFNNNNANGLQVVNSDGETIMLETQNGELVGFLDVNPSEFYPKDIVLYKAGWKNECQEMEVEAFNYNKSALFEYLSNEKFINPFKEEDRIFNGNTEVLPVDDYLTLHDYEVPPPDNGKGALFVSGYDPRDRYQCDFIPSIINWWKQKYSFERSGPGISESQIQQIDFPSKSLLCSQLDALKNKYENHFYFYLIGHGNGKDAIRLGTMNEDVISIKELFDKLALFSSDTITIILDSGASSDSLMQIIGDSNLKDRSKVYIQTSVSPSGHTKINISEDGTRAQSVLTTKILKPIGLQSIEDINQDGLIQPYEAFSYTAGQDPDFSGLEYGVWYQEIKENTGSTNEFGWLNLKVEPEFSFDLKYFSSWGGINENIQIEGQNIISGNGIQSTYIGEDYPFRNCPAVDFIYKVNNAFDIIESEEGILGLIRKKTPESEWEIVPNQVYDEENQIFSISNEEVCGEYRVARIQDPNSVTNINGSKIEILLSPNLVTTDLNVSFQVENNTDLSFNIIDLNGKIIHKRKTQSYASGFYHLNFNMTVLSSGTYILQLVENNVKSRLATFIKI